MNAAQVMNLSQLLRQTARLFSDRPGLIVDHVKISWQDIDRRVNAMACALVDLGVVKGDKILVHSTNTQQLFESCWVAFRLGCVWVPTNFRLTPPEVAYLASSSQANVLVIEDSYRDHIEAVQDSSKSLQHVIVVGQPQNTEHSYEALVTKYLGQVALEATVSYDDPLWFFYTSGTTGKPKAGVLTHGQMAFVVANHLADLIPGTRETDCSIAVAPLSHGAGIHALLNTARGAATILLTGKKLDPEEVWQQVERHQVTNLFTVPTIIKILVEHPAVDQYDHSSLRYVIYAGAPMYRTDQKLALQKLGHVLVQYFGLGEVTGSITVLPPHMHSADDNDPHANIGSCGRPRTGMEIAILDQNMQRLKEGEVGEICCRGPAVFSGYHGNPDATEKALRGGWFHTGDLGKLDSRGLLYITGRESDMYISGGSNVYPLEVEEVLLTHPDVAEIAIFGMPDDKWGEVGVAVIVTRPGAQLEAAQLLSYLEGRCAKYRWPHHFFFWKSMPKSGYGKIVKKDIKKMLLEQSKI